MITLRDYQLNALEAIHNGFRLHNRVLGICATGGGKTSIFAVLCDHVSKRQGAFEGGNGRSLILVNRRQLLRQTAIEVQRVCGIVPALEQGEHHASIQGATVVVASIDTIVRRLAKYPPDWFDLVVIDEAHLLTGKRAQTVINHFSGFKFGTTATPNNKGKKALNKFYDHVAFDIPLLKLIKDGFLAPITVAMSPLKIDINNVKTTKGDLDEGELTSAITPYFDAIAEEMNKYPHRKWLCFLPRIDASKEFAETLNRHGIRAAHVDGTMDNTVTLEKFRRGDYDCLTCSQLLYFGYNEPSIDGIVNLRQTKSVNFYEQLIGRGTRKSENTLKHELLVLDFLWQYQEMGLVRPAFVLGQTEAEIAEMQRRIERASGPVDLVDAQQKAASDIYAKLQEKLQENAKKKRKLINILDVVEGEPTLENYQPEFFPYPPSQAQLAVLERHGIDIDGVVDKTHASKLIDWLHQRIEDGKASQRQLALLRRMGIKCDLTTSFDRASFLLNNRLQRK